MQAEGQRCAPRPFSRSPIWHPGLPRPRRPQPAPPLAPVPGKSRPARGGRGSLPAGALRGAVLPAEGPARAVSQRGLGSACGAAPRPPEPCRARPRYPRPDKAPGPGNFARVEGRERLSLAPLLAREGPRRESGRRLAVLGGGGGRGVQGCAGLGPRVRAAAGPARPGQPRRLRGEGQRWPGRRRWVRQGSCGESRGTSGV